MPLDKAELDKIFCLMAKKYGLKKLFLKAVAICESSLDTTAYRYEPAFWKRYLKDNPEWKNREQTEVSASYGLMQLMYTTAWGLGFRGSGEDLYDPVINVELGAKLIRKLIDNIKKNRIHFNTPFNPLSVAMARYNGGSYKNPDKEGWVRNDKYMRRVFKEYQKLLETEKDCEDD